MDLLVDVLALETRLVKVYLYRASYHRGVKLHAAALHAQHPTTALYIGILCSAEWSGVEWSGVEWSGVEWSGVEWSGAEWSGAEWSGVEWSGVEWSGVKQNNKQIDNSWRFVFPV